MARQLDQYHAKHVQEDLRYLDEYCRARSNQTGKYRERPQNQQLVYYGPQVVTVRMPAATSNHTAQFYGGSEAEPTITSNQAAEQYGGLMITDPYGARKHYGGFN